MVRSADSAVLTILRTQYVASEAGRQLHGHDGAAVRWALNVNRPAVRLNEPFRRGKSEAAAARLRREERREDLLANVGDNPRTIVLDHHAAVGISRIDRDPDRSPLA